MSNESQNNDNGRSLAAGSPIAIVAMGGHAFIQKGQTGTIEDHERNAVDIAGQLMCLLENGYRLVVTHGNGPQVGNLLLQQEQSGGEVPEMPLDALVAMTAGSLGYILQQALLNRMNQGGVRRYVVTMVTQVFVDENDPAFANPTKPIGPVYEEAEAERLRAEHGWSMGRDGTGWRRVVPSPRPQHIFEARPIGWLVDQGVIVICTGGGGIPTMYEGERLVGAEVVIDKDLASALLAKQLKADMLVMATDVDGVYTGWGSDEAELLGTVTPADLEHLDLAAGSMGPKVEAACAFVEASGGVAVIGALADIEAMVGGAAGTRVSAPADPEDMRLPGL
jgi:carbamate kinase